jgi:hypothetical protein
VTTGQDLHWIDIKRDGQADERLDDSALAVTAVTEPDADVDLLGDRTEDRTDLRVGVSANRSAGIARVEVTVTNAGPLTAHRPVLTSELAGDWQTACQHHDPAQSCLLPALAVGASHTMVLHTSDPAPVGKRMRVAAEGPDLDAADNEAALTSVPEVSLIPECLCSRLPLGAKPVVTTARRHTLRRGVKVALRGLGRTQVTAAFKVRGRTLRIARTITLRRGVERTVTLRAHGAKLRTLRRAAERGVLDAVITVRNADGTATATTRVT